jgi:thiol-disulfide isomerase/thioredoxin
MSVTAYHFWSPTCGPCKVIKPSIEALKEDFEGVTWVTVNTQNDPNNFVAQLGVKVVPTIVVVPRDASGNVINPTNLPRYSGTDMAAYYRILKAGVKSISSSQ